MSGRRLRRRVRAQVGHYGRPTGTWGTGPFDNDTAADWVADLEEAAVSARPAIIRDALQAAVSAEDYLDADDGMVAIAASAVVARVQPGGPVLDDNYGPSAAAVEGLVIDADLRRLAAQAITRVLAGDSEWRELWEESGDFEEARSALDPVLSAFPDTAQDS